MEVDHLNYLLLLLSAGTALLAVSQMRHERSVSRGRSWSAFTLAVVLLAIAFGGAVITGSDLIRSLVEACAISMLAVGFVVFAGETRLIERMEREQRVDVETGLPNKRAFHERLLAEHSRTKRTGRTYAVAIFEIDGYQDLLDEDKTNSMKLLAKSLDDTVRNTDALARISEFHMAVMMVDTEAEGGIIGCERARERFFFQSCGHDASAPVTRPLTVSVGIAAFNDDTLESVDVVRNAERALFGLRNSHADGVRIFQREDSDRAVDMLVHAL
ncbi:MAG TPA: diguanylate cyclase [Solirubrobacterales bacterium]|jgi:diguanylate cyclase (GGDEF)-like protein|nr:diguanylate cyclase [Solirubrobacterales bacterium]